MGFVFDYVGFIDVLFLMVKVVYLVYVLLVNIGCEYWVKVILLQFYGFVVEVDFMFEEQVFDVVQGQWKLYVEYDYQMDYFG